jgi:hypothetical protein
LKDVEECYAGVPYATALSEPKSVDLEGFHQLYANLQSIKCPSEKTNTAEDDIDIQ